MIAALTLLTAFPLGYLVRNQLAASTAYAIAYLWGFTFQGVYLLLSAMDGDRSAFGPTTFPLSYGLVAAAIFGVGFALVWAGGRLRRYVDGRRTTPTQSRDSAVQRTS